MYNSHVRLVHSVVLVSIHPELHRHSVFVQLLSATAGEQSRSIPQPSCSTPVSDVCILNGDDIPTQLILI